MTSCACSAYKFPHRPCSGRCDGSWLHARLLAESGRPCETCPEPTLTYNYNGDAEYCCLTPPKECERIKYIIKEHRKRRKK